MYISNLSTFSLNCLSDILRAISNQAVKEIFKDFQNDFQSWGGWSGGLEGGWIEFLVNALLENSKTHEKLEVLSK